MSRPCRLLIAWALLLALAPVGVVPARAAAPEAPPSPDASAAAPEAPPAPAADSEARRLYREGQESYRRGDYDQAIAKLDAAYRLSGAPGFLYDLARAHRLRGDCADALRLYREYLARPGLAASVREMASGHAAAMEACVAQGTAKPPVSAVAAPTPAAPTPAPAVAPPAAVRPAPDLRAPAIAGAPAAMIGAKAAPPRGTERRASRRRAALACGAAAVVLGGAAGFFGWRAEDAANEVSSQYVPERTYNAAIRDAEARGQTSEKLEIASIAAALIAGGVAAWLALHD